ncbi:MAG: DUF58 domain-containing protein [Thermoleophilia bacterium]|nr:DUF58 domain-containing protein [Thermoleophilia bacterium]
MAKPVSPLVHNIVLVAGFGALIGAAWVGYSALVVLLGLALATGLVTKLWSRLCLKGVTCERRLSERRVFPDDEVLLTLRVANRKILPLPWIEIRDEMPAFLAASAIAPTGPIGDPGPRAGLDPPAEVAERPGFVTLSRSTPLLWYSAATFTQLLDSSVRGYYPLGPLSVISGDIFGLHPRSRVEPHIDHLIVYPRTYSLAELGIVSLSHLGDTRSELRVFDDPSRLMGVREYLHGDSLRRIHWKASARSRALQVKLFEPTTDLKVAVFLAVDTFAALSGDDLELGISSAASVARHLLERDVQTGLFANAKLADSGRSSRVAPAGGTAQLAVILEELAKTTADVDEPFIDFFDHERAVLGFGDALVFVVGQVTPEFGLLLADLTRAGRRVLGFHVGPRGQDSRTAGLRWHQVRHPLPGMSADAAKGADADPDAAGAAVAEEATSDEASVA